MKKVFVFLIIGSLLITSTSAIVSSLNSSGNREDFDPLVDVEVTFEVEAVRFLEDHSPATSQRSLPYARLREKFDDSPILSYFKNFIDRRTTSINDYNMFVKVSINGEEFVSDVWSSQKYVYNPDWSVTLNVPDDEEFVDINIQLWNENNINDRICDISGESGNYEVDISYSIKTGHWTGDDELNDPSGYGRLCGSDDGTIYKADNDAELWFNVFQNDYDGDGIPYWTEVNEYGSDPEVENFGDPDNDDIPVYWEWKWGYDPFNSDNHDDLDPDGDSIENVEEYLTSEWFSDPFRKDVFVELDIMDDGPNGEKVYFPVESKELLCNAFDIQNIVFHLDMGEMGGHDVVPFQEIVDRQKLNQIYWNYYDHDTWRRGVFHYGVVVYNCEGPCGYMFRSNAFMIASLGMEGKGERPFCDREVAYASGYMHELGHTFSFNPIPGHNQNSNNPLQIGWWINRPYKSCMNYGWIFYLVDYSDGSRRSPDIDDWERIDYNDFEREW